MLAYLRELGKQPATVHAFVILREVAVDAERVERACCIACENVWSMHGEPPVLSCRIVDEANDVILINAAGIVAAAAAFT
ncbi:MAG: hypothetical protein NVSMB64_00080 [Candidatus Velthaea sp.]